MADDQLDPRDATQAAGSSMLRGAVLYPNIYIWYVLLASLDILLTCAIIVAGGYELNALADWVLQGWGVPGLAVFKFSLVVVIICICEVVGRRRYQTGHKLAEWSVAVTAIPVIVSLVELIANVYELVE